MASQVIAIRRPVWSKAKHAEQWESTLATYASSLSDKRIHEITTADVLAVLAPIWTSKHETAARTRQRMETVFDWAIVYGYRQDNPAGKHVLKVLPANKGLEKHHLALPYDDVSAALRKVMISTSYPLSKLAFGLLVLAATRSGEVWSADWSEVDWESALDRRYRPMSNAGHCNPSGVKEIRHLGASFAASTTDSPRGMSRSYWSGLSDARFTQPGQISPACWPAFSVSECSNCISSRETFLRRWQLGFEHLTEIRTKSLS